MTLLQLTYIVAVEKYRSFSKAAKDRFVTQPTLSMQIQKLEEELGVTIFDRGKKPVAPTDIGRTIIEQAQAILRESDKIIQSVESETTEVAGIFRIGIIPTLAPYLLNLFLQDFITKHPRVELVIEELQTREITERLNRSDLDAGLLATPLHHKNLAEKPLFYEPFVAYVSEEHRLSAKKKIHIKDLQNGDLWLLTEGHCFRSQALALCKQKKNITPKHKGALRFESGNLDTLRKLVEQNYGMTLLPYLAVSELSDEKKKLYMRPFAPPAPKREISLVYNRSYPKKKILEVLEHAIRFSVPEEILEKDRSLIVHHGAV
ncbi:MAG TPA: hydrogen peroxide-inducible genes activator [bacterium]|nr:hydrogen peroxide-inducible genes activator [bacterium]HMZ03337.1 hydrogen peroxide-inducible genes activator [bacterium]HNB11206.1 hydrogen peroxide-inducible genes activator [bacterium]HNB55336.1 hydrogen peroxide-inducible genes activator [bacterium]HNE83010.1 hydrogen peroxide-inducible genes activator [bacterium]